MTTTTTTTTTTTAATQPTLNQVLAGMTASPNGSVPESAHLASPSAFSQCIGDGRRPLDQDVQHWVQIQPQQPS